jgi:hypothetical protein
MAAFLWLFLTIFDLIVGAIIAHLLCPAQFARFQHSPEVVCINEKPICFTAFELLPEPAIEWMNQKDFL